MKEETHESLVLSAAKCALGGILAGPHISMMLVNAMQSAKRMTIAQILVQEAWDMAEALVSKYEEELSKNQK